MSSKLATRDITQYTTFVPYLVFVQITKINELNDNENLFIQVQNQQSLK